MAQSTPQRASEADATDATSPGATGNDLSPNNDDIIEPLGGRRGPGISGIQPYSGTGRRMDPTTTCLGLLTEAFH